MSQQGPYKVEFVSARNGLCAVGPTGWHGTPINADKTAALMNLSHHTARREAIESAIGVVRKWLPFEMGDSIEHDIRAMMEKES